MAVLALGLAVREAPAGSMSLGELEHTVRDVNRLEATLSSRRTLAGEPAAPAPLTVSDDEREAEALREAIAAAEEQEGRASQELAFARLRASTAVAWRHSHHLTGAASEAPHFDTASTAPVAMGDAVPPSKISAPVGASGPQDAAQVAPTLPAPPTLPVPPSLAHPRPLIPPDPQCTSRNHAAARAQLAREAADAGKVALRAARLALQLASMLPPPSPPLLASRGAELPPDPRASGPQQPRPPQQQQPDPPRAEALAGPTLAGGVRPRPPAFVPPQRAASLDAAAARAASSPPNDLAGAAPGPWGTHPPVRSARRAGLVAAHSSPAASVLARLALAGYALILACGLAVLGACCAAALCYHSRSARPATPPRKPSPLNERAAAAPVSRGHPVAAWRASVPGADMPTPDAAACSSPPSGADDPAAGAGPSVADGGSHTQDQVIGLLRSGKPAFSVSESKTVADFLARQKDLLIVCGRS